MKRASIRVQEPTPELIEKIRRARVAISQQKPRYLKCPYCQHNSGKSIRYIASVLGFAPSSVHYELQHGFYDGLCGDTWETVRRYSADLAQRHSDFQVTAKGRPVKLGREYAYARSVAEKIRAGFSPDSIVGRFRLENRWTVSTTTLYRYIDSGYIPGISNQDLWQKIHNKKQNSPAKKAKRPPAGRSIELRPAGVSHRDSFGHWEMDSVVGKNKGKRQSLLVLTERFTRYEIIVHPPDKTAKSTVNALNKLIRQFPDGVFRTITVDNGSEFADSKGIEFSPDGSRRLYAYYGGKSPGWAFQIRTHLSCVQQGHHRPAAFQRKQGVWRGRMDANGPSGGLPREQRRSPLYGHRRHQHQKHDRAGRKAGIHGHGAGG